MSDLDGNNLDDNHEASGKPRPPKPHHKNRIRTAVALGITGFVVLGIGAAAGAGAMKLTRPNLELAPMTPVAISSIKEWSLVTIKGKVAEVFGNKFIVQDDTGRALIETGPSGDDGKLVAVNEAVSVQGRFENGFLHASYIVRQDGSIEALGPVGGPRHPGPLEDMLRHLKPQMRWGLAGHAGYLPGF
jgi:hypothetical protein